MNVEFIEAIVADERGNTERSYLAVYHRRPETTGAESSDTRVAVQVGAIIEVLRQSVLDLDGLDDMAAAEVLVEAILDRMRGMQWPQGVSPEALLFAVVNEALQVLDKTAADFLLTEDSPTDSLTT